MKINKNWRDIGIALLTLSALGGCSSGGGGGGGTDGGTYSYDPSSNSSYLTHQFQVKAGNAYTYRATSISGEFEFLVYDTNPQIGSTVPECWETVFSGGEDTCSFIATADQTMYVTTMPSLYNYYDDNTYKYTLKTSTNHLSIGVPVNDSVDYDSLYYSFDAEAGKSYEVEVLPTSGDVDIDRVSPTMDMSNSLGSSTRDGLVADKVGFTAVTSGRYFISVSSSDDSAFKIAVNEITTEPDLEAVIKTNSDGIDLTISYTIYNNGLTEATGFQITAWSDLSEPPASGATGDVSETVASIPAYGSVSGTFTIPTALSSGTAYLAVDSGETVLEDDESNNIVSRDWVVTQPDLQVSIDKIYSDGTDVKIYYKVENNGSRKAGAFNIDFWANPASAPAVGDFGDTSKSYSSLSAGSNYYSSITIPNTDLSGTAYALVDTENSVDESDETNNVSAATAWEISYPDLQVTIDSVKSNGKDVTIDYTVTNGPDNSAAPFSVDFWTDLTGAPVEGMTGEGADNQTTTLGPNGEVSGTVVIPSLAASGTVYAYVDAGNFIAETNDANNASTGVAWTASYPDLEVNIEKVISDGVNADVTVHVRNVGEGDAGSFNVELWVDSASAPTMGTTGPETIFFDLAYPLTNVGYASKTVTIPFAGEIGTAYAIVDTDNSLPELDETNNVSDPKNWAITHYSPDTEAGYIDIPNNDTVTGASASITLSGATTSVSKVVVGVNIWLDTSDIDIYLESPAGTLIELSTDNGCGSDNYGDSTRDALFDDDALESVLGNDCTFIGAYRPEQRLADLNGEDANGTWILHVYDDNEYNTGGTLRSFSLAVR